MKRYIYIPFVVLLAACGSGSPSSPSPTSTGSSGSSSPANIAGSYNLTLTASPTCAGNLPSSARTLRYGATISQSGTAWQASLSGGNFSTSLFQGSVSGSRVQISIIAIGDIANLAAPVILTGTSGSGTVGSGGEISGTLNAQFGILSGGNCNAFDHQFRMVRK